MRRLLKFGCVTVIILVIIAGIAAALGPTRSGTTPPQQLSENIPAAQQPTAEPHPPTATASQAEPQTEHVEEAAERCEAVEPAVVADIETGLTVTGGGTLRGAQAVLSQDFEQVWFVAADIQGEGLEGGSDIAVWAMNDISAPVEGLTIAVNNVAREFSDWGSADERERFTPGDDGVAEAEQCVASAVTVESADSLAQETQAMSRGLGLSESEFGALYGTPQEDIMGNAYAVGNGRIVAYEGFGDPVSTLERVYDTGVSYDDAVAESKTLMPTDAVYQEQYVSESDLVVDVYSSEWLKGRFPDPDDWINAEPGVFIVLYGAYNPVLGVDEVTRWVMATGNNP